MIEQDFLNSIDCKFPYSNIEKGKDTINNAISISDNSVFGVIYELFNIPRSLKGKVDKKDIIFLLSYIDNNFKHNFKNIIIHLGYRILNGDNIKNYEILNYMDILKNYKGLYGALSLLYFFGNDLNYEMEEKYNEVIEFWNKRNEIVLK